MDLLYLHAADMGIEVEWRDLGDRRRGEYWHDSQVIVLNSRLTRAQATAALAHEIGHAVHGDRCSSPSAESRADETGASLIIEAAEYEAAECMSGEHPGALARHLDVTPRLVLAWRRWYSQTHGPVKQEGDQTP